MKREDAEAALRDTDIVEAIDIASSPVSVWQRIRKDRMLCLWLALTAFLLLIGFIGPWFAPHDPYETHMSIARRTPGWVSPDGVRYWFGTDVQGRDLFSRVLYGLRATLAISLASVFVGSGLGVVLGILAAYYRRLTTPIMRLADVLLAFPTILFGLSLSALLGPGIVNIVVALSISAVPGMVRVARSAALSVTKMDFMEAGRSIGFGDRYLIWRYLLPNCSSILLIYTTLQLGSLILLAALLSFLGLGPLPPFAELGTMAADGRSYLEVFPHIATIPTAVIFIVVLVVNLLGDSLRDAFDPKLSD